MNIFTHIRRHTYTLHIHIHTHTNTYTYMQTHTHIHIHILTNHRYTPKQYPGYYQWKSLDESDNAEKQKAENP